MLYRHRFDAQPLNRDRRAFVVLDGVFYFGDVWLDADYLAATEGYFFPHEFEITDPLRRGDEHVLAVEVACPRQSDRTAKRLVTGVFSHWDNLDPDWNPGGLWRPVRVVESGPVRLARVRCVCIEATEERGRLRLDLTLDAAGSGSDGEPAPRPARFRARLTGPDDGGVLLDASRDVTLAGGDNHLTWTLDVDHPPRWWPRRLGEQPRCDLEVVVEAGGEASDRRTLRTAFREVQWRRWQLHVNGERLFVMGSNQGPSRMQLGEATAADLARDVQLALGRQPRPAAAPRTRIASRDVRQPPTTPGCSSGRTSRSSGDTPGASASRRSAKRARWSTCSGITRASCCGARTTSRSPSTSLPASR